MLINRIRQLLLQKSRHLFYLLWSGLVDKNIKPDMDVPIDVMIPAIESDLEVLPLCIEGVRRNVLHPIKDIYLVSPDKPLIKEFAVRHGVTFINEDSLLGYAPAAINYTITAGFYKGLNRSGWIFQQLVKLSGTVGTCRYYLAIDADHILMKPHVFVTSDAKSVFYQSSEFNAPYYKNIRKLLRQYSPSLFSYVSHKMIFDKQELMQLHRDIESKSGNGLPWDQVIIASLDSDDVSGFSEFELYGKYVANNKKKLLPWKEKMLTGQQLERYDVLQQRFPECLSLTFPAYLNKKA